MLLQAAMGAGMMMLIFGGLALFILTPFVSIFAYNAIEWIIMKSNPSITELKGIAKVLAFLGSIILGILGAFLLTFFVFWLLFKDVTFD